MGTTEMSGKPLIESDRVEGTTVFGAHGQSIGTIKRLMIEKTTGRVAYAVVTFGGFMGLGEHEHTVPWSALTYDPALYGYRTDIDEEQVRGAPDYARTPGGDLGDREREQALHDHYGARYYWSGY